MLVVCLGDTDRNLIETDTKNVTDLEIDHLKNPQFLPNQADIQAIVPTHELVIFNKFDNNWIEIVDFYK